MATNIAGKRVSDHLDLIRGLAAVAVLVYHVRYRFFLDYRDLPAQDLLSFIYYAATSFGHDAVIVFFVLSGYFISASVIKDQKRGTWSWQKYTINRLSRLYVVLLPGLFLTVFWDSLGLSFFPANSIYSGAVQPWHNDFFPVANRLTLGTFLANTFFLQSIYSPPLGSNDPLWSLSFEFWFYVLFPFLWIAFVKPSNKWTSLVYVGLFLACAAIVGRNILFYFPIWLLGTLIHLLPQLPTWKRCYSFFATFGFVGLFCGAVAVLHVGRVRAFLGNSTIAIDYTTGFAFAALMYVLLHNEAPSRNDSFARMSKWLAGFSFTLYVVHMPLLVFLRASFVPDAPWSPDILHMAFASALALACLIYAWFISRCSEAQTDLIRGRLMQISRLLTSKRSRTPGKQETIPEPALVESTQ